MIACTMDCNHCGRYKDIVTTLWQVSEPFISHQHACMSPIATKLADFKGGLLRRTMAMCVLQAVEASSFARVRYKATGFATGNGVPGSGGTSTGGQSAQGSPGTNNAGGAGGAADGDNSGGGVSLL